MNTETDAHLYNGITTNQEKGMQFISKSLSEGYQSQETFTLHLQFHGSFLV